MVAELEILFGIFGALNLFLIGLVFRINSKIAALEASDMALLKAGARSFEDLMSERVTEGKFVAQKIKDIIAERVTLRAK